MRQSIFLKSMVILAGVAALGGAVFVGFRHTREVRGETAVQEPIALSETYTHPKLGFSFRYPAGLRAMAFAHDEQSEVVLVEGLGSTGFQVFTLPFDEAGPITHARIRTDVPDLVMAQRTTTHVGGVEAVTFISPEDPDLGRSYEVWFVHGGTLYQAATYADWADHLNAILATWTFDE